MSKNLGINTYWSRMFIAIQIKHSTYVTSTTMLLFYIIALKIDTFVLMSAQTHTMNCKIKVYLKILV